MQKRKGFTTVELVIVIAVIAILATALIPTFGGLIKSANHNVDVQAANQLTTLVVMHSVNHPITSECDLADAINKGMNDPNYYATLQAKSAKYGYCFWYDYKDPQGARVRVGTVEEISAIATERVAQAFSIDDVRLGSAGSTSATHSFGLRADLIDGFVLMGYKGGNDLMDLVCNLENAEDVGAYADAIAAIKAADSTNTAIANLQSKATSTVIHNEHGVFAPSSSVTSVHIPQGTDTLSNNRVVSDLTITDVTISIPSGTTVASGSLTYLGESCTVEINITAEELPNNIALQAITAEIKVSNGDRYTQDLDTVDANIFKLVGGTEDDNIKGVIDEETAKNLLNSYVLGDNSHEFVYIDIYTETNEAGYDGTIYISKDLADTNFSIVAENFLTANKESTTHGIFSWSVNGKKKADTGKTISINSAVTSVTVKTMGVEYTYAVKVAGVESIAINEIGGVKATRNVAFDAEHYSWKLTTQIALTDGIPLDSLTLNKTIRIHSDSNGHFTINSAADGSATLSISASLKNDSSNKVVFLCSGKQSDEMTINLIDTRNAAFKIKADVDTQTSYGFKYVVGTHADGYKVKLGDLFEPKAGAVISGDILLSKDGASTWKTIPAANWSTTPLDLSGFTSDGTLTVYIKVAEGQYNDNSIPLVLDIKKDAYNVASLNDWKNAPNNTSIVLINSLTGDNAIPGGDYTTANADGYSKNIGAATIYGNLKTISVPDNFKIKYGDYNYFILATTGGKVEHLVLVGPDYGKTISVTGTSGSADATSKGTFVAAIKAIGGSMTDVNSKPVTITNCFLSGFRSPLHVQSGKVVVENTTLHLGNYANLYVDQVSDITLTDVTTVQYTQNENIGAGISYKYSAKAGQILTATGLKQYNFLTEDEVQKVVDQAGTIAQSVGGDGLIGTLIGLISRYGMNAECADFQKVGAITHTIDGTPYYHMGITAMKLVIDTENYAAFSGNKPSVSYYKEPDADNSTTAPCSDMIPITKKILGSEIATLYVWGLGDGQINYNGSEVGCSTSSRGCCKGGCNHSTACTDSACQDIGLPSKNIQDHIDAYREVVKDANK